MFLKVPAPPLSQVRTLKSEALPPTQHCTCIKKVYKTFQGFVFRHSFSPRYLPEFKRTNFSKFCQTEFVKNLSLLIKLFVFCGGNNTEDPTTTYVYVYLSFFSSFGHISSCSHLCPKRRMRWGQFDRRGHDAGGLGAIRAVCRAWQAF